MNAIGPAFEGSRHLCDLRLGGFRETRILASGWFVRGTAFSISALLFSLVGGCAHADLYACKVISASQIGESGEAEPSIFEEAAKEETLVVNTQTGEVRHAMFGNDSYFERIIVDGGSSVSAFKVIGLSPPGGEYRNMTIFQMNTWELPKASFFAFEGQYFGYGFCK